MRPHVTLFRCHVGRCQGCRRRVVGRDARQTSTATGAAASQVGPNAVAWAAGLHTGSAVRHEVVGFDDAIKPGDADFDASGLKAASLIRLGFLAVLPASGFSGDRVDSPKKRHRRLVERLSQHIAGPRA